MKNHKIKLNIFIKFGLTAGFLALIVAPGSAKIAYASDITPNTVVKLVNEARKKEGVPVLTVNQQLKDAAEKKADDMIKRDYFAHISPKGKTPWDFISEQGYDYKFAGENLAIDYTDAKEQQDAWMNSPLHRKNILNSDYKEIGVATKQGVISGHNTTITVQEFGTKIIKEPTLVAASVKIAPDKSGVAGAYATNNKNSEVKLGDTEKPSFFPATIKEIKNEEIFKENKLTLFGWTAVFIVGIISALLDVLIVVRKNHVQA